MEERRRRDFSLYSHQRSVVSDYSTVQYTCSFVGLFGTNGNCCFRSRVMKKIQQIVPYTCTRQEPQPMNWAWGKGNTQPLPRRSGRPANLTPIVNDRVLQSIRGFLYRRWGQAVYINEHVLRSYTRITNECLHMRRTTHVLSTDRMQAVCVNLFAIKHVRFMLCLSSLAASLQCKHLYSKPYGTKPP